MNIYRKREIIAMIGAFFIMWVIGGSLSVVGINCFSGISGSFAVKASNFIYTIRVIIPLVIPMAVTFFVTGLFLGLMMKEHGNLYGGIFGFVFGGVPSIAGTFRWIVSSESGWIVVFIILIWIFTSVGFGSLGGYAGECFKKKNISKRTV